MTDFHPVKDSSKELKDHGSLIKQTLLFCITIKLFTHDNSLKKNNWMCKCGLAKEKESHITSHSCPVYSDIRSKYVDFNNDEDLVSFFNEVLERRDKIDSLEQDERDCG